MLNPLLYGFNTVAAVGRVSKGMSKGPALLGLIPDADHGNASGMEAAATTFANWLGKPVLLTVDYPADDAWASVSGWSATLPKLYHDTGTTRNIVWSVPLTVRGTSLSSVASGAHDGSFNTFAAAAAQYTPLAIIRLGWEFNGNWYPWCPSGGGGSHTDYINAFRHVVGLFRAKSSGFKIDWCTNWSFGGDPSTCYPGDDVVDIIGMDAYDQRGPSSNFVNDVVNASYGFAWLATFAARHGKPMSVPEWGAGQHGDNPGFIQGMYNWIANNNVYYQCYWDNNQSYPAKLDGSHPQQAAKYKELFGK